MKHLSVKVDANGTTDEVEVQKAIRAEQDGYGDTINTTYAKINGTCPDMTVGYAARAGSDGDGNSITETYAKKQTVSGGFVAGENATAPASEAIAIGNEAAGNGVRSVAIGSDTNAQTASIAIGSAASGTGNGSVALGVAATTSAQYSVGVGYHATAVGESSVAIGNNAQTSETNAIAIGNGAKATASGAVQISTGTNSASNTLQFKSYQIIDNAGTIHSYNNKTIIHNSTDTSTKPQQDQIAEVEYQYNGVIEGTTECVVKSDGYRVLQFTSWDKGEFRGGLGIWNYDGDVWGTAPRNNTIIANNDHIVTMDCIYPKNVSLVHITSANYRYRNDFGTQRTISMNTTYIYLDTINITMLRSGNVIVLNGNFRVNTSRISSNYTDYVIGTGFPRSFAGNPASFVTHNLTNVYTLNVNASGQLLLARLSGTEPNPDFNFLYVYVTDQD